MSIRFLFLCFLYLTAASAFAQVRLPKLTGDGMVLQRNAPVRIWGWAGSREKITVAFKDSAYQTVADDKGEWEILLGKFNAGGAYTMTIEASNTLIIKNILIGDVWICSGQSNMELPMKRVAPLYEAEIASADYPQIRYFEVPKTYNFNEPQTDVASGQWTATDPNTVLDFSAAAYFFAKEIYDRYQIPVGLINTALGGSPVEAWISEDSIRRYPDCFAELQRFKDPLFIRQIQAEDRQRTENWYGEARLKDQGYASSPWHAENLPAADWSEMNVPGYWAEENGRPVNGVMWFRKEIDLPAAVSGKQGKLLLGRIVDADSTFINGQFVGTVSYQYPPRRYDVPAGVLKEGKNTLAVRVVSNAGRGGFVEDKPYRLELGNQTIDLRGAWQYKAGVQMEALRGETAVRWKPSGLYNAMIAPLLNYPIKGTVWYQGESNTAKPAEYRDLFATLINDWRSKWHQGDFPFLFVQLANYMEAKPQPSESNWAALRESQLKTLSLPNTGMAVAIDIGEWNDIHPLNKKDIGKRLALAARKQAYGENDIVYSGPVYESMKTEGNKIILTFSHAGSGLTMKGDELHAFAIAGKDNRFVWAKARIEGGNHVIVWSDEISDPVAVRYAWADNPENANLYNREGLPASPFRTAD